MASCYIYGVTIRTTIDLPVALHAQLRRQAVAGGTSMKKLIVRALEHNGRPATAKRTYRGPLINGKGRLGPRFPKDETPYDLLLPDLTVWLASALAWQRRHADD
jgi:hypothetical protein